MSESWIVFFKNDNGAWKVFATTDNYFYALWIRDKMLETGQLTRDRVDISRSIKVAKNYGVKE